MTANELRDIEADLAAEPAVARIPDILAGAPIANDQERDAVRSAIRYHGRAHSILDTQLRRYDRLKIVAQ